MATRLSLESSSSGSSSYSGQSVVVTVVGGSQSQQQAPVTTPQTAADAKQRHPTPAAVQRTWKWKLINYIVIPACLPLFAVYWLLALLLAICATFMIWPSLLLARHLYWACPFIPYIWRSPGVRGRVGVVGSWLLRLQFEGAHCTTVLSRLLTLPLRPHLPDFYLLGFPKCGTTSMASYLRAHPAVSGLAGMPGNETFSKESHFFGGILGRSNTTSARLYRSFFPTIITRWWSEVVLRQPRWMCFDACPTAACLPYVAARAKLLTPEAKLVVMVRDPVCGVFSAETMLRDMGVPLSWSLTAPLQTEGEETGLDPRFKFSAHDIAFWQLLERLPPSSSLPHDLPERFYFNLHSYLQAGRFADRLRPWIEAFGRDRLLLVDYKQFCAEPEATVKQVLQFVGADTSKYTFKPQPRRMANDYKGKVVDAGVADYLGREWFAESDAALESMMAASGSSP